MSDLSIVAIAWGASYWVRFRSGLFPETSVDPEPYLVLAVAMLALWHLVLRQRGLYQPRRGRSALAESRVLIECAALATLGLAAATFFWKRAEVSRAFLVGFFVLSASGLCAFRGALRGLLRAVRRRGFNTRKVLVVGVGELAAAVSKRLRDHPESGFDVVGFAGSQRFSIGPETRPVLGDLNALRALVDHYAIDQVLIAFDRDDPHDAMKTFDDLSDTTAAVRLVLDLAGLSTVRAGLEDLDGLPTLRLVESPLIGWNRVTKRAIDLALSASLLVLLAPLFALIAAAVKLTGPAGPVLYRQRRMGINGRVYTLWKFRTMVPDAEARTGPRWTERQDARVTALGARLRHANLDELPQLWNVLRGEMSLVGPRPERPELIAEFRQRLPGYMRRHTVKAGLTGLAQVNGWRGNTSIERRLDCDIEYIRGWSLRLDLKILGLTLWRSFRDPNAY
ncbi:MAG: undecaprenyl-phosphate glucose phosphotransferase [Myxococcota bacterium]